MAGRDAASDDLVSDETAGALLRGKIDSGRLPLGTPQDVAQIERLAQMPLGGLVAADQQQRLAVRGESDANGFGDVFDQACRSLALD